MLSIFENNKLLPIMKPKEIEKFKAALRKDGRTLTWFYAQYLAKTEFSRGAMYQQLNSGLPPSQAVQNAIRKYLKKK